MIYNFQFVYTFEMVMKQQPKQGKVDRKYFIRRFCAEHRGSKS